MTREPPPTLEQNLKPAEYPYALGFGSYDKARDRLEDMYACCELSACEQPRIVPYIKAGFSFWAIVLTDTALETYL